jgi:hypothetical protein
MKGLVAVKPLILGWALPSGAAMMGHLCNSVPFAAFRVER